MVTLWEGFRERFIGVSGDSGVSGVSGVSKGVVVDILEKESVVRLGQRVYHMAEYVSKELTPDVGDEYATMVHGDYKAMVSLLICFGHGFYTYILNAIACIFVSSRS
mmetsp:Transcript_26858/g.48724  ORF Transcript_26858/g.48724 Transcript_26858/m.48724 type:complete len:107 (-) Transcript_26858:769-1089(-)